MFLVFMSHPLWVRGLKSVVVAVEKTKNKSHPLWVRGLKLTRLMII